MPADVLVEGNMIKSMGNGKALKYFLLTGTPEPAVLQADLSRGV